jgi:type IV pilus assembly protein PilA
MIRGIFLSFVPRKNTCYLKGFTLTELMVVVIIVGILAAVSLPNYVATREKALDKEAIAGLRLIRAGERQYFSQREHLDPGGAGSTVTDIVAINTDLATDLTENNWNYAISNTGGGFSATASRAGRTWTATQAGEDPTCAGTCY